MSSSKHRSGHLLTTDGLELFYQSWTPPKPKRVLLFIHGLAEHSGRYLNPIGYFTSHGAACWAIDLRGHGHSPGRRVHVDHFDDYAVDVATLHHAAREQHPNLPLVLVGHSMGGLITLRYTLNDPQDLAGAIVSSPGLAAHPKLEPPVLLRLLARVLSRLAPRLLIPSDLDSSSISRDPKVIEAYLADPLVSNKVSARWYTSIVAAQAEVFAQATSLECPLLLMQSGGDTLVNPEATSQWAAAAPAQWVEYKMWEGLYHEMFNEPERDEIFKLMDHWLLNSRRAADSLLAKDHKPHKDSA